MQAGMLKPSSKVRATTLGLPVREPWWTKTAGWAQPTGHGFDGAGEADDPDEPAAGLARDAEPLVANGPDEDGGTGAPQATTRMPTRRISPKRSVRATKSS